MIKIIINKIKEYFITSNKKDVILLDFYNRFIYSDLKENHHHFK